MKSECQNIYDVVVARAVTDLMTLYNWAKILLKRAGILLALKGYNIKEEIYSTPILQKSNVQIIPVRSEIIDKARELVVVEIKA